MSNADKKVTVGNVAAFFRELKTLFMEKESYQSLRNNMGLGDTLDKLPVENMAITIVDDAEAYAEYGAADGYVLSPLAAQGLGMTSTGGSASFSGIAETYVSSNSGNYQNLTLTCEQVSSSGIGIASTGEITILSSGMYRFKPTLYSVYASTLDNSTSGCTGVIQTQVTLFPSTTTSFTLASHAQREGYDASYVMDATEIFLVEGTVVPAPTFGATKARYSAAGSFQASGSGTSVTIAADGFDFAFEVVRIAS